MQNALYGSRRMGIEIYAAQPGSIEVHAFHARTGASGIHVISLAVREAWDDSNDHARLELLLVVV